MPNNKQVSGWVGWIYFAGILMIMTGIFEMIAGLTALLQKNYYVVTPQHLLAFSITSWGWIHLILGIIVIAAGSAVMNGRTWGRIVGIALAVLSASANFLFISAYPIWSALMIVVAFVVIYALMIHGGDVQELN